MKKSFNFLAIILIISFLGSCKKDNTIPPTIVKGQVVEQSSNKPIEGVKVVLMEGTFGKSSGTYSYYPLDTFLTDKSGNFTYEHKLPQTLKAYRLWYFKDNYFDISSVSDNVKVTDIEDNKTINPKIKMSPFAWLKIRVVNDKPFDEFDEIKIGGPWEAGGLDDRYYGKKVDITFIKLTQGGKKSDLTWWVYKGKDAKFTQDSVYIKPRDTTYYEIKY